MGYKTGFVQSYKEQRGQNKGLLNICFRVIIYSLALFLAVFYGNTWMWTISVFTVFSFVFELLSSSHHQGKRFKWYVASVLGIALAGFILAGEATYVSQAERDIGVLDRRVNEMVHEVPGVAVSTNADGTIESCSTQIYELTGYQPSELMGRSVEIIFPDYSQIVRERLSDKIYNQNDAGWVIDNEVVTYLVKKNGQRTNVKVCVLGLRYSVGRTFPNDVQFVGIVLEVRK